MAGTLSLGGLRRKRRNGLGTVAHEETRPANKAKVASGAQQTQNGEDLNYGDAENHVAEPHGHRIMPSSIKSASEAAMVVARILIENIQRGSGEARLEARVEDFDSIDHAENPTENERCEERELVISRETTPIESAETREGEAKHGADEKGSNTAGKPEGHETNIKNGDRMDKPIQKDQGNIKPKARKSKETSNIDEAIEFEVLAEYAMIYSLAKDPDPQIQQCYA